MRDSSEFCYSYGYGKIQRSEPERPRSQYLGYVVGAPRIGRMRETPSQSEIFRADPADPADSFLLGLVTQLYISTMTGPNALTALFSVGETTARLDVRGTKITA